MGDGRSRTSMEHYWQDDRRITWKGLLPNDETQRLIGEHDVLVLPSKYDGWGAVINEALMHGTRVVCSSNCGAATLIGDKDRGNIFSLNEADGLKKALLNQLKYGRTSLQMREAIRKWSQAHISGQSASEFFVKICKQIFTKK